MLERIFGVVNDGSLSVKGTLVSMLFAVMLGVVIALAYAVTTKREEISKTFLITVVLVPAIASVVITLVGSNTAAALSIAGVFALVRFRSAQGDGKDIALVFLGMAAGLATGMNFLSIALGTVVVAFVVILAVHYVAAFVFNDESRELRILIPENMEFAGMFDDLFETYTVSHNLHKVKTTNMGTLYELSYTVKLKKCADEKKFIDDIRVRNGNLTISLSKNLKKESAL